MTTTDITFGDPMATIRQMHWQNEIAAKKTHVRTLRRNPSGVVGTEVLGFLTESNTMCSAEVSTH